MKWPPHTNHHTNSTVIHLDTNINYYYQQKWINGNNKRGNGIVISHLKTLVCTMDLTNITTRTSKVAAVMSTISAIQYPRNLWNDLMVYRTLGIPPPSEVSEAQMKWPLILSPRSYIMNH